MLYINFILFYFSINLRYNLHSSPLQYILRNSILSIEENHALNSILE